MKVFHCSYVHNGTTNLTLPLSRLTVLLCMYTLIMSNLTLPLSRMHVLLRMYTVIFSNLTLPPPHVCRNASLLGADGWKMIRNHVYYGCQPITMENKVSLLGCVLITQPHILISIDFAPVKFLFESLEQRRWYSVLQFPLILQKPWFFLGLTDFYIHRWHIILSYSLAINHLSRNLSPWHNTLIARQQHKP